MCPDIRFAFFAHFFHIACLYSSVWEKKVNFAFEIITNYNNNKYLI